MTYARIWYEPTGVKITFPVDGADIEQVAAALRQDGHIHRNATFEDCATKEEFEALIPSDRSQRNKWAKANGRRGVEVKL